eukprot:s197_g10.t1
MSAKMFGVLDLGPGHTWTIYLTPSNSYFIQSAVYTGQITGSAQGVIKGLPGAFDEEMLRESKGCHNLLKRSLFGSQALGSTRVGWTAEYAEQCPIAPGGDMGDSQKGCFWSGNLNELMENP